MRMHPSSGRPRIGCSRASVMGIPWRIPICIQASLVRCSVSNIKPSISKITAFIIKPPECQHAGLVHIRNKHLVIPLICLGWFIAIIKSRNLLAQQTMVVIFFQDIQPGSKVMTPVAPDQMAIREAVHKMHMNNIPGAHHLKPLLRIFSGYAHGAGIDHSLKIRMADLIKHAFDIL